MSQVTAVKHALLHAQYVALEERTQFPVALLQQMAEARDYDLAAVERDIDSAMRAVADAFMRDAEQALLRGGPGGDKQVVQHRFLHRYDLEAVTPSRGVVLTCVS